MAIIIGVVLAIAISSSSARIQTINGDLNEDCNDDPNWIDNKYGDGSSKCTDMTSNYCENYGEYSTEAQKNCPVACGMCSVAKSCTCKDLISKWGYGNCQGTLDSSRGNAAVCYVNQPSSCGDLVDSSTNTGEKSSAEPCSQGSGYENPEFSSGLKELSTQLLTSTRAPTLQTTENIQSTQGNTPGHQSSHCRDQKIWCNLADCSLANVKRNCQKTCNLC